MSTSLRDSFPPGFGDVPSLHSLWGTFLDPAIESAFAKENHEQAVRKYVRFSVTASIAAFLAYGLHDWLVIPEARFAAWSIRYGVMGPIGALLVFFLFRNRKHENHQAAMLLFGLGVNLTVLWIGAVSGTTGYFIYTGYAVVFVTLGPFIARMNVKTQVLYTILTLGLFNAFDLLTHSPMMVRISFNLAILTLGTIGTLSAHQLEVGARLAYLQRRIIREQMAALDAERSRSETLLLNVLPKKIADRLKAEPSTTIADRFGAATVLFSDIVGFTELSSRLPPDELVKRLDTVFSAFDDIADQLGLEKIKTIGDAYMAAAGIPRPRADHAEAVCEMALRIRDAVAALDGDLAGLGVRIGVHSGPVVAGVIGKKKFIYDVWGDTVNIASRMESHGVRGAIQVSDATYALVKDKFVLEPRGEIQVKGKGAMTTYVLVGRRELEEERNASLPSQRGVGL